ncbi:hypothetical protein ACIGN6_22350 [Streptomyces sp. NPDC053792]|uniref:hypothetical protein n=1 Tax=Streptomyces sp. NPDC053792 TaxID=3365716 RepID=UPI0037D8D412
MTPEETSDMALTSFIPLATDGGRPASGTAHGELRLGRTRRRQGLVLMGAGLALLPWLGYLAGTLPPAEAAAWIGLDALEAAALLTAGSRLMRGDARHRVPAAAAAALLLADACVDLATSAGGPELAVAVAMAVLAELPLAVLCAVIAARPPRSARCGPQPGPSVTPPPRQGQNSSW